MSVIQNSLIVLSVLAMSGCECSRQSISFEATQVCAMPDAGRPESGEPFIVRASPGTNLDAGCSATIDGGQLVFTVSGIDIAYGFGDEAIPPGVTCTVEPLPPGTYSVNNLGGGFTFDVPSADAGFPVCTN